MSQNKIKSHKTAVIIGMIVFSILVDGGFFPIMNFNPNNPVASSIWMRIVIVGMALLYHQEIGLLEAAVFTKWSVIKIAAFNAFLISCGLSGRYLLEFGEISNVYNFTAFNIAFQMILLTVCSTVFCMLEKRKQELSE